MGHHQQSIQCLEHPRNTTEWLSQQGLKKFWELHKYVSGGDKKSPNLKFDIDAHLFLETSKCQILWSIRWCNYRAGEPIHWAPKGYCGWFPTNMPSSTTFSFATRRYKQSWRKWAGSKKNLKPQNKCLVIRKKEPPRKTSTHTLLLK